MEIANQESLHLHREILPGIDPVKKKKVAIECLTSLTILQSHNNSAGIVFIAPGVELGQTKSRKKEPISVLLHC